MPAEVKKLAELISKYIGPKKELVSSSIENLLPPGENYLSILLKIDVTLRNEETGNKEKLCTVGKTIHSGEVHEVLKFVEKLIFKYEKNWYTKILPTLQNFLKEKIFTGNFDLFPELIACRANLHGGNEEVDDDSILLLENLIVKGFSNIDRHLGFDYEGAKFILKDLATFHAVPLVLKLKKPKLFEEKILKYLDKSDFKLPEPKKGKESKNPMEVWFEALESRKNCKLYLTKLIDFFNLMQKNPKMWWGGRDKREPFATISHNDLWVNNTMQTFKDGKMVKNKFVDFQAYGYDSPARDLLFFIWANVQLSVIKEHFYDLLEYYRVSFLDVLNELGCKAALRFTYEEFVEEIKYSAKFTILQAISMMKTIFREKGKSAMEENEHICDALLDRCALVIQICGKNGWM